MSSGNSASGNSAENPFRPMPVVGGALSAGAAESWTREKSWMHHWKNLGWVPIIIGAMAMTATYPGRTHGLGMVTEPLLRDFNLSTDQGRVFYASLNFWGTLLGAFFCLPVGWLFDRLDRRAILAGNMILLGMSVIWMATVSSWPALFVGILLTRGLGQSALSVVSLSIVAKSIERERIGLAMAVYAVLSLPFHILLIKGVGMALNDYALPWREVWKGVGIALIVLSTLSLFLKGSSKNQDDTDTPSMDDGAGATLFQALGTPAFWVFSMTISLWGMIYAGVALFNQDIFQERGFEKSVYFNVLAMTSIVAVGSKFLFGWMLNFVSLPRLLSTCLAFTAVSLGLLPMASQTWHAYAYGLVIGIASGAVALLFFATWAKLYGKREVGRIQGVAQMMTVFASAAGPAIFSYSKLWTSSYTFIFLTLGVVMLGLAIVAWFTPTPQFSEPLPS